MSPHGRHGRTRHRDGLLMGSERCQKQCFQMSSHEPPWSVGTVDLCTANCKSVTTSPSDSSKRTAPLREAMQCVPLLSSKLKLTVPAAGFAGWVLAEAPPGQPRKKPAASVHYACSLPTSYSKGANPPSPADRLQRGLHSLQGPTGRSAQSIRRWRS